MDVVKVTLRIPDQKSLADTLALVPGAGLNCGAPGTDESGQFLVDLYVSAADAKALAKTPYIASIDEKYGAELKKRQGEVGKGDRFKGGTVAPAGLGVIGTDRP